MTLYEAEGGYEDEDDVWPDDDSEDLPDDRRLDDRPWVEPYDDLGDV